MGIREGRALKKTSAKNGSEYIYQGGGYIERTHEKYQEHPRDKKTERERQDDSKERLEINAVIRTLRDKYEKPAEETLEIISDRFSDSQYKNFFKGWVENAYKTKYGYNGTLDLKVKNKIMKNEDKGAER